ncbi:MAG: hypothetical protein EBS18_04355 [Actinobacteria bacterium]|nr:hypothetical protein [Actinomycetota bacterium]
MRGYLSLLPIGAAALPWLAIRNGYRRSIEKLSNTKSTRIYFILNYLLVYSLLALVAGNSQANIDWQRGPITVVILLISATFSLKATNFLKLPAQIFSIMLGVAGLIFTISLVMHFHTAKNLSIVLQPGIIGGFLLLLLQIAYLPNIFIASLSYIFGAGIYLGSGTNISPSVFSLKEIPAIPVLAALPNGKVTWLIIFTVMISIYGWVNLVLLRKSDVFIKIKRQNILRFFVISVGGFSAIAALSSGSLITSNMSPVGVNVTKASLIIAVQLLGVLLIQIYLPKLIGILSVKDRVKP